MFDGTPLSGISGLSFGSPFLSPFLFFCQVPLLCLVNFLLTALISSLFSRKFSFFFVESYVR